MAAKAGSELMCSFKDQIKHLEKSRRILVDLQQAGEGRDAITENRMQVLDVAIGAMKGLNLLSGEIEKLRGEIEAVKKELATHKSQYRTEVLD